MTTCKTCQHWHEYDEEPSLGWCRWWLDNFDSEDQCDMHDVDLRQPFLPDGENGLEGR